MNFNEVVTDSQDKAMEILSKFDKGMLKHRTTIQVWTQFLLGILMGSMVPAMLFSEAVPYFETGMFMILWAFVIVNSFALKADNDHFKELNKTLDAQVEQNAAWNKKLGQVVQDLQNSREEEK